MKKLLNWILVVFCLVFTPMAYAEEPSIFEAARRPRIAPSCQTQEFLRGLVETGKRIVVHAESDQARPQRPEVLLDEFS